MNTMLHVQKVLNVVKIIGFEGEAWLPREKVTSDWEVLIDVEFKSYKKKSVWRWMLVMTAQHGMHV